MSVTFTAELTEPAGFVVACVCRDAVRQATPRHDTYDAAVKALMLIPGGRDYGCQDIRPALPGCEYPERCPTHPLRARPVFDEDESPDIKLDFWSAVLVLNALGFGEDARDGGGLAGSLNAKDFLGRVLLALAVAPEDEGVPAHERDGLPELGIPAGLGGLHIINFGRPAGYLQQRLRDLEELARWCLKHNRLVQWA